MGIGWQNVSEEREMRRRQLRDRTAAFDAICRAETARLDEMDRKREQKREEATRRLEDIVSRDKARKEQRRTLPGYVYRCFAGSFEDPELLYVGMSKQCAERALKHLDREWGKRISFITVERFATYAEAEIAEAIAIRDENPPCNRKTEEHRLGRIQVAPNSTDTRSADNHAGGETDATM